MFKFLKSNLREAIALLLVIPLLWFTINALGLNSVAESGPLSALVSLAVTLISGIVKFAVCLALAWAGLAVTFPEAAKHVFSVEFDAFWGRTPTYVKFYCSLVGAAVLSIVAALCMASS